MFDDAASESYKGLVFLLQIVDLNLGVDFVQATAL